MERMLVRSVFSVLPGPRWELKWGLRTQPRQAVRVATSQWGGGCHGGVESGGSEEAGPIRSLSH